MKNISLKNGIKHGIGIFITVLILGIITVFAANWYDSYTVNVGDGLTATKWNLLAKSTVPTGAVMAFNLTTCPDGWKAADGTNSTPDLRGEFIRGLDNGRLIDSGRTLGSWQVGSAFLGDGDGNNLPIPNLGNSTHRNILGVDPDLPISGPITINYALSSGNSCTINGSSTTGDANTCTSFGRTRPRNVALLYCVKN